MAFDPDKYKNISTSSRFIPVVLLLDVSSSMDGAKIENLYDATVKMIETFADESKKEIPYKIAIITFGASVDYHTPYTDATKDTPKPSDTNPAILSSSGAFAVICGCNPSSSRIL